MHRRVFAAIVLAAAVLPLAGCYEYYLYFYGDPFYAYMRFVEETGGPGYKSKTVTTQEATVNVDITADVGGLSGDYAITLDDPDGGTFGSFSGTGTVKRGRFVTLKDNETPELFAAVEALLEKALGADVTVTKAKAKVKAWQEPGGVAAAFEATISYSGTVNGGEHMGAALKGKMTASGSQSTGG